VVGFHAFPTVVRGGFAGVDIFFVISGFLISGIIFSALERGSFSFIDFYARRIRRIFPSLIVVLLFAAAFGWLFLLPDELTQLGENIAGSGVFANNFLLWADSGYFDTTASQKPLLHLWSLGIEEQFYLSYPLLVWLIWRRSFALTVLLTLFVVSLALNAVLIEGFPYATFYSPLTRAWELLIGCLLAYASTQALPFGPSRLSKAVMGRIDNWVWVPAQRRHDTAATLGVVLIVGTLVFVNKESAYPGLWALLPTLGAACLIAAGGNAWINNRVLGHPSLLFLGLISYPLYLWHWVLLSFANIVTSGNVGANLRVFLVLLSVLLAWITYRAIERPIRTGAWGIPKTIGLGVAMTSIALAGLGMYLTQGAPSRFSPDDLMRLQDVTDFGPADDETNCPSELRATALQTGFCRGSSAKPATAVIWGDSHAERVFEGVANLEDTRSWLLLGAPSCPPVIGIEVSEADRLNCKEIDNEVAKYIARNAQIDTVVMTFANYTEDDYAADAVADPIPVTIAAPGIPTMNKVDAFALGLGGAVTALQSKGKRVVIVIDNPELPFFPKQCLSRPFVTPRDCFVSRAEIDRRQHNARAIINSVAKDRPGVMLFDPLELFCDEKTCEPIKNGVMLYFDSHHLSQRGAEKVASQFLTVLPQFEKAAPASSLNCALTNSAGSYSAVCRSPSL